MINREGRGAVLYMRQEGRGIGLANKLHAYKKQEEGLDTVEANVALGFAPETANKMVGESIAANPDAKDTETIVRLALSGSRK